MTLGETVGRGPRYGDFWDSDKAIFLDMRGSDIDFL